MAADLLVRLLNPSAEDNGWVNKSPSDDYWYQPRGSASGAGVNVTAESAMKVSAVFGCVRVLAETVLSVPLLVYRRLPNGGKERAPEHPLYGLLHSDANAEQSAGEFREMLTGHTALRGTSYAEIVPGPRGPVDQLVPIHPDRIRLERLPSGVVRYQVKDPATGSETARLTDEIFRLPGLSGDGLEGMSILRQARESIGLAVAAEQYGARSFSSGVKPSGVLQHPGKLGEEPSKRLRSQFDSEFGGFANAGKTILLEEGMTWAKVGMTSEDAQFLESRRFQVEDIARWFRMPLHMIQDYEHATFSNVEHLSLDFVLFTMMPWFIRWEQRIQKQLVLAKQQYFVEFLVDGLLRGDTKTRFEAYNMAINGGWMNRQEIRLRENLNPGPPELEQFLQPGNMNPAGTFPQGQRQAQLSPRGEAVTDPRARLLAREAASRIVHKSQMAIEKAARKHADDGAGWESWLREFYGEVAEDLTEHLYVEPGEAQSYAAHQRDAVLWSGANIAESWAAAEIDELTQVILGRALEGEMP